jgi:hypothetical protein
MSEPLAYAMFATIFMLTPSPLRGLDFCFAATGAAIAPAMSPATAAVAIVTLPMRFIYPVPFFSSVLAVVT